MDNKTLIKKRMSPAIISTPMFSPEQDPTNFYYSLLVLFVPHRNENILVNDDEDPQLAFIRARDNNLLKGIPTHRIREITAAYDRAKLLANTIDALPDPIREMHILNDNQEDNNYTEILNNIYEYDSDDEDSSQQGETNRPLPTRIENERQVAALKR